MSFKGESSARYHLAYIAEIILSIYLSIFNGIIRENLLLILSSFQFSGSKATFHKPFSKPPCTRWAVLSNERICVLLFLITFFYLTFIIVRRKCDFVKRLSNAFHYFFMFRQSAASGTSSLI